jgi:hypothetical protein
VSLPKSRADARTRTSTYRYDVYEQYQIREFNDGPCRLAVGVALLWQERCQAEPFKDASLLLSRVDFDRSVVRSVPAFEQARDAGRVKAEGRVEVIGVRAVGRGTDDRLSVRKMAESAPCVKPTRPTGCRAQTAGCRSSQVRPSSRPDMAQK